MEQTQAFGKAMKRYKLRLKPSRNHCGPIDYFDQIDPNIKKTIIDFTNMSTVDDSIRQNITEISREKLGYSGQNEMFNSFRVFETEIVPDCYFISNLLTCEQQYY